MDWNILQCINGSKVKFEEKNIHLNEDANAKSENMLTTKATKTKINVIKWKKESSKEKVKNVNQKDKQVDEVWMNKGNY